ncbi:GerW family sporulation protein [Methanobacterium oryzae]|uniref:GerW family sporulation protein n=1 Tax=Methanobacterium oryzae TaxID=69540 RepID=UPI003D1CA0CA
MAEEMMRDLIKTTVDELLRVLATDNVIGETIEIDDKVIVPITRIGLAFGTGGGSGGMMRGQEQKGHGAGGGAAMETKAVVVVHKGMKGPESVEVITIGAAATLSHVMAQMAPMAKKMMRKKEKMGEEGSEGMTPSGPGSESRM